MDEEILLKDDKINSLLNNIVMVDESLFERKLRESREKSNEGKNKVLSKLSKHKENAVFD